MQNAAIARYKCNLHVTCAKPIRYMHITCMLYYPSQIKLCMCHLIVTQSVIVITIIRSHQQQRNECLLLL